MAEEFFCSLTTIGGDCVIVEIDPGYCGCFPPQLRWQFWWQLVCQYGTDSGTLRRRKRFVR